MPLLILLGLCSIWLLAQGTQVLTERWVKIFSCNEHCFLLCFFGLFRFVVKLQRKMRRTRSWVLKNQKTNKGTSMYICTSLWLWSFQNEQKIVIFTHIWVEKLKSIQKYLGLILFVCLQGRRRWCKWDWVYYKTG